MSEQLTAHQRQIMREGMVERLIQEGIREGKFSNLANEGQPIKIEQENPYIEDDMRLVYKIMSNANLTPPWVNQEKEVEAELNRVRRDRDEHRRFLVRRLNDIKHGSYQYFMRDIRQLGQTHQRWMENYEQRLKDLNEKIHSFNHNCPVPTLLKIPLHVQDTLDEYERSLPAIPQV